MRQKSRSSGVLLLVCLPAMYSAFAPAIPSGQARAAAVTALRVQPCVCLSADALDACQAGFERRRQLHDASS